MPSEQTGAMSEQAVDYGEPWHVGKAASSANPERRCLMATATKPGSVGRREFLAECTWQVMKWSPWLGLLGFQFHRYTHAPCAGWAGYVTWCGKLVGFVPY